ncbi:MAG: hypothetical protein E6R03_05085 [Hyphomicrobiaceae bacterium]|nr:MAG: hypothetical protein E6R03_05085 [Hyphomicrobiaceae bacterium]
MRHVPILEIADAIKAKIKGATHTRPLSFVDLDEFWSLDTSLSQLTVPCAVIEYLGNENIDQTRHDVVQQTHHFAVNYVDKVAGTGSKRRDFLVGLKEIQRPFVSGRLDEILDFSLNGVEITGVFSAKAEISNDLKDRNLNWGRVLVDVDLNAYEV